MKNVYTVRQVNAYIKNMFTQDFALNRIYIKGEISNCKYHTSGHIYFTLKEEGTQIQAVMFAGDRRGLAFRMREGQMVVALGSVSVYERDGKYQLYAKEILLEGAGLLHQQYEAMKKRLEEMGMFDEAYKQPIPRYISRLGVVTAPTGAAVRDIINVARRRNPYVQIILCPAIVQGEMAAGSIARAIQALDRYGVDVMIVGRGGGSLEDLWAFNEEMVARAIFECATPVISAVGHEVDTTIADYVADLRAATPSAAAEQAVFDYFQFRENLETIRLRMYQLQKEKLLVAWGALRERKAKLEYLSPTNQLNEKKLFLADADEKLRYLMVAALERKRHRLGLYAEALKGLSPLSKLSSGYAFVTDSAGRTVASVKDAQVGGTLQIHMADGVVNAMVQEKKAVSRG